LRENHEKAYRFGLHQLRNCSRAAASSATGIISIAAVLSFAGVHHSIRKDRGRGGYRRRSWAKVFSRYVQLNEYVAAALSVPDYFDSLTADSRPDLCGKPSCSWRIVSSDLGELLVNPSGLMKSIRLPFSSCLNARDGGQLQVEFLYHRMTHLGCVLQTILTGRE
jgi:hypothetical protein